MADASVYEGTLASPDLGLYLGRLYNGWDLVTATQSFRREVPPELRLLLGPVNVGRISLFRQASFVIASLGIGASYLPSQGFLD